MESGSTRLRDKGLGPPKFGDALTGREVELIRLVGKAQSNKRIGEVMGLTCGTVKVYLVRIFAKLAMTNRVELALWANQIFLEKSPKS